MGKYIESMINSSLEFRIEFRGYREATSVSHCKPDWHDLCCVEANDTVETSDATFLHSALPIGAHFP